MDRLSPTKLWSTLLHAMDNLGMGRPSITSAAQSNIIKDLSEPTELPPLDGKQKFEAIAVMGATGSGKSTFINKLIPDSARIGHDITSCTEEIESFSYKLHGSEIVLIDTPGFNDTDQLLRSDTAILQSLMDFMKQSAQEHMLLKGIIYLHPLDDVRMTGSSVTNLNMFRRLVGDDNLSHVVLTSTRGDGSETARKRQSQVQEQFWGPLIACGAQTKEFLNTTESAKKLVDGILRLDRFVPQIQKEAVENVRMGNTEAGAYLTQTLEQLRATHEREIADLRAEIERARKQQNKKLEDRLQTERLRLEEQISRRVNEQKRLSETELQKLQTRNEELVTLLEKAREEIPINHTRFWHLRWRCMGCKGEKTEQEGIWTCSSCELKQNNTV